MARFGSSLRFFVRAVSFVLGTLLAAGPLHAQPSPDEFAKICVHGSAKELAAAIAAGADVNALDGHYEPPLMKAVFSPDSAAEKIEMLLKANADVTKRETVWGNTVLHIAAFDAEVELMAILINAGADVNAVSRNDATPLAEVCYKNRVAGKTGGRKRL